MCGIAGILRQAAGDRVALDRALDRMLAGLVHRGPDGEGRWVDDAGHVALGHRRLAIVDLTPTGAQPMTSADGRWVISFNGEVYAYRDLRKTLEGLGARFVGTSDTEVLLEAVARWGVEDALARVNGMYALALWDTKTRELWLARDPAGEKPLYVWDGPGQVVFASELGALRSAGGLAAEVDTDALATYLQLGYVPAPLSIYRGVAKLEAGEWRRYRIDGTHIRGTTVPRVDDLTPDPSTLLEVLADAVAIRMVADVPVGIFLSGGIDSTLIAALAARAGSAHTFTAAFGAASHDESVFAARVARALGTEHTELAVSAADGLDVGRRLSSMYGEPFGDPSAIPTHLIAAEARQSVGVALTGDGGDELFGGYNRLVLGLRLDRARRRLPRVARDAVGAAAGAFEPDTIDRWTTQVRHLLGRRAIPNVGEKVHKAVSVLGARSTPAAIASLVSMWEDAGLLVGKGTPRALGLGEGAFSDELLALDRRLTLPEQMLTKVDRATMAVGLEARPPLLDPRVMALAAAAPFESHVHGGTGKQLLRGLVSKLIDPALLDRPKMGFDPPVGAWLRGPLRMWADELLQPDALGESGIGGIDEIGRRWASHLAGSSSEEGRLWTLLQYQLWFREEHAGGGQPPSPRRVTSAMASSRLEIRRAAVDDQPRVHQLLSAALGSDPRDQRFERLLRWKHQDNPFGPSPAWVAVSDGEVVGYRAFLRWEFEGEGRTWSAVRAVDTATDPRHQGRGIFRALTLHGIEELQAMGVDFVFNTPNDQSRPGYLKMGWQVVDQLTPWVRPASLLALPAIARGRAPASHWGEPIDVGEPAADVFADERETERLLRAATPRDARLRTRRSAAYLRWRYEHELLGYRVLRMSDLADGVCCFRLRRRGEALEATVDELLVPGDDPKARRSLLRQVIERTGAHYALVLNGSPRDLAVPLVGQGPTLVWRNVCHTEMPERDQWDLSMGDIELF